MAGDYDDFKKRDKSEKVTVVHIEPLRQLIRWTDLTDGRFSKLITAAFSKTNSIPVGMVRDEVELLNYDDFDFLEDDQDNPFLTDDNQFYLVEI